MLVDLEFDTECLGLPCWRLKPPIEKADLEALAGERRRGGLFADAKLPAADVAGASRLLEAGFTKACVQVELRHDLRVVDGGAEPCSGTAGEHDHLALQPDDIEGHAAHFVTSRFRQDVRIPEARANHLYARWIANSLAGRKRVFSIGRDFCTYEDKANVRTIDLLSVLDKRRGHARALLISLLDDARRRGLAAVHVVTEVENAAARAVYRSVRFEMVEFHTCLHLWTAPSVVASSVGAERSGSTCC